MNLAQNVCLDDFKVMYSFLSSDSLKFFRLGQFLSNYWSLFVCVEVLRPSQPNGVMSSVVSLPNHTFTGQA